MLFERQKCPYCHKEYDIVLANCEHCHALNPLYETNKMSKRISWFPYTIQILFFVIGFLGFSLIALLAQGVVSIFLENTSKLYHPIVNSIAYIILSISLFIILFIYRKNIIPSFKNPSDIAFGLALGILLICFSLAYSNLVNLIHPIVDNDNQKEAINMIVQTPVLAVLVLGILGPICEEITYRLGLFSFGLRVNKIFAFIITPLIFGFIHFNFFASDMVNELLNIPSYIIAGLILCFSYYKFGFVGSVTSHIVNNLFSVIVLMIGNL